MKRGGRVKYKQWRNGKGGAWNCRISWFHRRDENQRMIDIRLRLETPDESVNVYPATPAEADAIWDQFKQDHPRS